MRPCIGDSNGPRLDLRGGDAGALFEQGEEVGWWGDVPGVKTCASPPGVTVHILGQGKGNLRATSSIAVAGNVSMKLQQGCCEGRQRGSGASKELGASD